MTESDISLDHVTKRFGDVLAVDDLSLEIHRNEFFSLLGPSGCGKTTTLRMVAGFEAVTEGTIYLGGQDVTGLPPYRRDVNTVFQSYALFPHLDVYENVAFGLRRRRVPAAEVRNRVNQMLELVQLPGYGNRRPSMLSGGQQQRVALARALVNHPRVLLLDEPLGALDLKLRKQMQIELKRIQAEVGITFVYVTHDQDEAMTMSDRIAVMRAGRIEQLGGAADLYERPATEFVAGFLGVSNLIDAEVVGRDGGWLELLSHSGRRLRAPLDGAPVGATARIGVRPEKLQLATADGSASGDDSNELEGTIADASYIGVSMQYLVRADDGSELVCYSQNAATAALDRRSVGERVTLRWRPQHTFILPTAAEPAAHPAPPDTGLA